MNSSIRPKDGTLTSSTTPGLCRAEISGNERTFHIPQTPGLEPHHHMQFSVKLRTIIKLSFWKLRVLYTHNHNQLIMTTSITNEYTSLYKSLTLFVVCEK